MGCEGAEMNKLLSPDGHEFRVYRAGSSQASAGLVVIQEIFGLNSHIRGVCDRWADEGYEVISPALFDRVESAGGEYGLELGYGPDDLKRGSELARAVGYVEKPLLEIEACLRSFAPGKPVGVVGFCWGGALAWMTAVRLAPTSSHLKACVGYYGGMIAKALSEPPRVPVMLHFGRHDKHIPMNEVEAIQEAYPEIPVFVYEAGHGFNCDQRQDYDPESADLARRRTLDFFGQHLQGPSPA